MTKVREFIDGIKDKDGKLPCGNCEKLYKLVYIAEYYLDALANHDHEEGTKRAIARLALDKMDRVLE